MAEALRALVDALADLYAAEGRPGGAEAAAALRDHRNDPLREPDHLSRPDRSMQTFCDKSEPHPIAHMVSAIWDRLPWYHPGLEEGSIPDEIATTMMSCQILGPKGLLYSDSCKVGLFGQSAGVDYATRTHAAEETFVMLAGHGEWRLPPEGWYTLGPGGSAHHPSMVEHQSRSTHTGFLAAWRWTGDIGMESYSYTEEACA
ncbi:MAG: dimethylsulfonioproprionate lyase family protein [Paracoccaceae bacterium]